MGLQTPCVADRCEAVFDRRFLQEDDFDSVRREIVDLIEAAETEGSVRFDLEDLMVVHPTLTPDGSPLVRALEASISDVLGGSAALVASPGTYDQKHFARIAGIEHCVAYGPGTLEQAHQADEWCSVEDMVRSAKVIATAILRVVREPILRGIDPIRPTS